MINNATIETLSDNSFWLRNYVYGPRCEKAKIPILPAKINSSTILIGKQISREEKNMAHHYRCRIFWNISNLNVVVFFFLKYIQIGFCVMKRKSKKCFHVYLGIEFPNFYLKMISGFFPAQTQEMQIEFISACTIRKGIWQKPLTLWWNVSCENYSLFKLK